MTCESKAPGIAAHQWGGCGRRRERKTIFTAVYLSRQFFLKPAFFMGLCLKCPALKEAHSQLCFPCHPNWNPFQAALLSAGVNPVCRNGPTGPLDQCYEGIFESGAWHTLWCCSGIPGCLPAFRTLEANSDAFSKLGLCLVWLTPSQNEMESLQDARRG